jgi:hypothetical protein
MNFKFPIIAGLLVRKQLRTILEDVRHKALAASCNNNAIIEIKEEKSFLESTFTVYGRNIEDKIGTKIIKYIKELIDLNS